MRLPGLAVTWKVGATAVSAVTVLGLVLWLVASGSDRSADRTEDVPVVSGTSVETPGTRETEASAGPTSRGTASTGTTPEGTATRGPGAVASPPTGNASGGVDKIQGVRLTKLTETTFRVDWTNPADTDIGGWVLTYHPGNARGATSRNVLGDSTATSSTQDMNSWDASFQFRLGELWQVCVAPTKYGPNIQGAGSEMPEREGCSSPFIW